MYLLELVEKKKVLDKKIEELKAVIGNTSQDDNLAKEIISLIEERQSLLLNIQMANNVSTLNIGGKEVSIATAIEIRNTLKSKIDVVTILIEDKDCDLDKIELQSQRDKYYEEYILLTMGICRTDLQVRIND
jgi:hypothetical protein